MSTGKTFSINRVYTAGVTDCGSALVGIAVKGMMYKGTKLQLNELDKKNDIYQAFKKYAQKTDKQFKNQ